MTPVSASPSLACPACADHRNLEVFSRYEAISAEDLCYCPGCYGFWVRPGSIDAGIADAYTDHPSLRATVAPTRCKACLGHLKPDGVCARCGAQPPARSCPSCTTTMERMQKGTLWLDACPSCHGCWFDTGEIAAVYGLVPAQGLAASTVDETAAPGNGSLWMNAIGIILRVFLPL